jgi:uncharacterized protein YukE
MPSELASGRRFEVAVPSSSNWEELNEAAETYRRLVQERNVTARRLGGLQGERVRAVEQERHALAAWLKSDRSTKEPDSSKVAKIDKEIKAAERRLLAVEEAIDDAISDLIAVVDEHRDEWREDAERALAQERAQYAEAVEALAQAREKVSAAYALTSWVNGFPEFEQTFRVRGAVVGSLKAENGEPYWFAQVVDALRQDATQTVGAPRRDPNAEASQRHHEERMRNERDGRGYWTDKELDFMAQNEVEFFGGQGARLIRTSRPQTSE